MKEFFEGYYYKHQKGDETLCIIAGKAGTARFIQVITEKQAWQVPFTEGNKFTTGGIRLAIETPELSLKGEIRYENLTPLGTDIMGPFRFFSMECSHGVISMGHRLRGKVELNGKTIDFTGGKGYIEMDKGRSFPSAYTWVQANDFADALQEDCSIMAAVAKIPFFGLHFRGCICAIYYKGKEYRLATYRGVRVLECSRRRIVLRQGKYRLEIEIEGGGGHRLRAPVKGEMSRTIVESASCPAWFTFFCRGKLIFHLRSEHAGFEYEE